MKYFLDSAKLDEIMYADKNWGIDGVTTNPRHIQTSGKPFYTVIQEIADYFKGRVFPISIEIDPTLTVAADMVEMGKKISAISTNFIVKIPCTEQGLVAAKTLNEAGIRTNVTLVFSPTQALQAARINATYCSPFIGWREANGEDDMQLIERVKKIYKNFEYPTEIIVAATRNSRQIAEAAMIGADIVTAGFSVYKDSFYHPYTDYGNNIFVDAWKNTDTTEPNRA